MIGEFFFYSFDSVVVDNAGRVHCDIHSSLLRERRVIAEFELGKKAAIARLATRRIGSGRDSEYHIDYSFRIHLDERCPTLMVCESKVCKNGRRIHTAFFHLLPQTLVFFLGMVSMSRSRRNTTASSLAGITTFSDEKSCR